MMFEPTFTEIEEAGDLLGDLIKEGRRLVHKENSTVAKIRERQEEASSRSLALAQRAMARLEWRPRASIAMLNRCICAGCGRKQTLFAGYGVEMVRQHDTATRIVMTQTLDPAYVKGLHYISTVTPACMECLVDSGFELESNHGT